MPTFLIHKKICHLSDLYRITTLFTSVSKKKIKKFMWNFTFLKTLSYLLIVEDENQIPPLGLASQRSLSNNERDNKEEIIKKMNLTKTEKKQHLIDFIVYSISNFNKIPSYYYLERILGRRPEQKIDELIQSGEIELTIQKKVYSFKNELTGDKITCSRKREYKTKLVVEDIKNNFYYNKLKNMDKNPNKKCKIVDMLLNTIAETLQKTTIDGSPVSTDVIFKKGRFYSEYTNFEKSKRNRLKIDGEETSSIDIKSSVLQLMVKSGQFNDDKLLNDLNSEDFWSDMATRMGISREELKEDFIKNIFGNYTEAKYYREYKSFFSKIFNIRSGFGYKMVFNIYQELEWSLMSKIYETMMINGKNFLPMHDCIIVKNSDVKFVEELFNSYNVNVKNETIAETNQKEEILSNFKDKVNELNNIKREMANEQYQNRIKTNNRLEELLSTKPNIGIDENGRIIK